MHLEISQYMTTTTIQVLHKIPLTHSTHQIRIQNWGNQGDKEHRWTHLDLLQKSSIFSGLLPPDHGLVVRVAGEKAHAGYEGNERETGGEG